MCIRKEITDTVLNICHICECICWRSQRLSQQRCQDDTLKRSAISVNKTGWNRKRDGNDKYGGNDKAWKRERRGCKLFFVSVQIREWRELVGTPEFGRKEA